MSTTFSWIDRGKIADGNPSSFDRGLILALTTMFGPASPFDAPGFGIGSSALTSEWYFATFLR